MTGLFILRINSPDRPGIVAAVATTLSSSGCNIEESAQYNDHLSGQFFMRVVFAPVKPGAAEHFRKAFEPVARDFAMTWQITPQEAKVKTLILLSREDHCLSDLLYRWRTDHLQIDIAGIVSNHETAHGLAEERRLPFHLLPAGDKEKQEAKLQQLIRSTDAELIVLARYMQILSPELCSTYEGRIINIHHSFLPGFKGAKPYHQAYERGVKIIGATAHFATNDLDEGPIIEQETVRVDHRHTPQKMQALGRDTEARVLARAIELYTERRIFLHGQRTVIL